MSIKAGASGTERDAMAGWKALKRRWRKLRNRLAGHFFDTRYGRELLVNALPDRVLTMTTDCGDHVLSFSPHDYIGRKVYRKGHFERPRIAELTGVLSAEGALEEGRILLEIGANIGTQSIYWALARPFRHIVAVEADPRNFALLSRNIADNELTGLITAVQVAAGEAEGVIDFFQNPDNHGKSAARRTSARDRKIEVPVRPVTSILGDLGIGAEDIGLIWMDIEGYEPVACRSMEPLLALGVPLYMEFTAAYYGTGAEEFRNLLASHYSRAIVFPEDGAVRRLAASEIPLGPDQYDVLLLR